MPVDPVVPQDQTARGRTTRWGNPIADCHWCGDTGIGGYVDHEMASDAGEPSMAGQPIPCVCVAPPKASTGSEPF